MSGVQTRSRRQGSDGELQAALQTTQHCPVINCGASFSGHSQLKLHLRLAKHSPCHPFHHVPYGRVVCDQVAFLCPVCGKLCDVSLSSLTLYTL